MGIKTTLIIAGAHHIADYTDAAIQFINQDGAWSVYSISHRIDE